MEVIRVSMYLCALREAPACLCGVCYVHHVRPNPCICVFALALFDIRMDTHTQGLERLLRNVYHAINVSKKLPGWLLHKV